MLLSNIVTLSHMQIIIIMVGWLAIIVGLKFGVQECLLSQTYFLYVLFKANGSHDAS